MALSNEAAERFAATESQPFIEPRSGGEPNHAKKRKGREPGGAQQEGKKPKRKKPKKVSIDLDNPPPQKPVLIGGLLRRAKVLAVGGASKAGKTWLFIQLALAVVTGGEWLGFECAKGRVLVLDGEMDSGEAHSRIGKVASKLGIDHKTIRDNLDYRFYRGFESGLNTIVEDILEFTKGEGYSLVIIDPSYKFLEGEENNSRDVKRFTDALDKIASKRDCAVVYCQHHSKGGQGEKRSMDRMSGSGVFARHADAVLDLVELEIDDGTREELGLAYDVRAFRVETDIRSFAPVKTFDIRFEAHLFMRDDKGIFSNLKPSSPSVTGGRKTGQKRRESADDAFKSAERAIVNEFARRGTDHLTRAEAMEIAGYQDKRSFTNRIEGRDSHRPSALLKTYHPTQNECWIVPTDFSGEGERSHDGRGETHAPTTGGRPVTYRV